MTEAAIQPDVVEVPEKGEGVELIPDTTPEIKIEDKMSREDVMEGIAARRKEELLDEIGETIEPEVKIEPIVEPEPEPIAEVDKKVKIKVDGVESEVTEKEIREYQKQLAADKRLQASAMREKELNERQARLDVREQEIVRKAEVKKIEEPDDSEDLAEKLISSVFDEDKKSAADIIRKLKVKPDVQTIQKPVSMDPDKVSQAVTEALSERDRKTAITKFETDYVDLASRPGLRAEVNERTKIEMQEDPNASWEDIIVRAADYVKEDLAKVIGIKVEPDPVKTELEIRAEKKSGLETSVKAAAGIKADINAAVKRPALTPIQEIMKSRGQPH